MPTVQTDTTMLPVPVDEGIFGGAALVVVVLFALFAILFVCVVGFIIYSATRRYRAAKQVGLDPFAGDIQLAGQARNSAMLAPQRTVADRLAEVDSMLAAGTISPEEHAAARARIIATV